jgi:hypothetical protein
MPFDAPVTTATCPSSFIDMTALLSPVTGTTTCAALARYVATVLHGLAVQAASGATEKELRLVSAMAMRAWPS